MARHPKRSPREIVEQDDLIQLFNQPAFRRVLLRVYEASGMGASADGPDGNRLLMREGRRSLGFDIFRWVSDAVSLTERQALCMVLAEDKQPPGDSDEDLEDDPSLDD